MPLSKIEICRKIVSERSARKVKDKNGNVLIDMFTASMLVALYENLTTDEAKASFEKASWQRLGDYVYKKAMGG